MTPPTPTDEPAAPVRLGLAVIYRFRLKPGLEGQFREGWERVTRRMMAERGALGSRLHRTDEQGLWIAYAQWPDRDAWQASRDRGAVDPEGSRLMREAAAESFEPILLEPVCDHLQPVTVDPGKS